jgi:hypothetical protein
LEGSISQGLVSGIRPAKEISEQLEGFRVIQFTAPISHGNSGGPLLDEHGNIVGLVSAYLPSGQNVNLAVPSNYVSGLVASAKAEGHSLTKMRSEAKRSGVLLAGYGSPASGFQIMFIELMNFLAAKGVAVANEPSNFRPVTGDYVSLNYLLDYVKSSGGDGLLYVTVEHGYSNIHRMTLQCFDKDGKLLWQEKTSSTWSWAASEDGAARAALGKMEDALKRHIGQPGLLIKKNEAAPSK